METLKLKEIEQMSFLSRMTVLPHLPLYDKSDDINDTMKIF